MSMTNANFQPRRFFKSGGTVSREQLDRLSRSANIVINGDARLSTDFGRGTKIEIGVATGDYPFRIRRATKTTIEVTPGEFQVGGTPIRCAAQETLTCSAASTRYYVLAGWRDESQEYDIWVSDATEHGVADDPAYFGALPDRWQYVVIGLVDTDDGGVENDVAIESVTQLWRGGNFPDPREMLPFRVTWAGWLVEDEVEYVVYRVQGGTWTRNGETLTMECDAGESYYTIKQETAEPGKIYVQLQDADGNPDPETPTKLVALASTEISDFSATRLLADMWYVNPYYPAVQYWMGNIVDITAEGVETDDSSIRWRTDDNDRRHLEVKGWRYDYSYPTPLSASFADDDALLLRPKNTTLDEPPGEQTASAKYILMSTLVDALYADIIADIEDPEGDIRAVLEIIVGGIVEYLLENADHGMLGGLDDDDHEQYLLLSGDTERNVMSGVIADGMQELVINPAGRSLHGYNSAETDISATTLNWTKRMAPIADAETEHSLDDTDLASLKADTEAALDALGEKINDMLAVFRQYMQIEEEEV